MNRGKAVTLAAVVTLIAAFPAEGAESFDEWIAREQAEEAAAWHPEYEGLMENVIYVEAPPDAQVAAESCENEYSGISISEEELSLLYRVVAAEAQNQDTDGQKAVAEVIFNRVLSDDFPDSVYEVLSQKRQFSGWTVRNESWVEPDIVVSAVDAVIAEGRTVLPDTEYLFFNVDKLSIATDYIKIGDHQFGRAKK